MTTNKRFVKYDGNTIVDLKLVKSWIISNGNVELLLEILNNEQTSKKEIISIRKRCTDCKYTKGIGIDFWCGQGHTEYEVFMGETNCPYFEYHDWSKGTPSETETAESRRKEIDKLRKDNNILKQQRDYLFDVIDEVLPHSGSTTVYNRMKDIGDEE